MADTTADPKTLPAAGRRPRRRGYLVYLAVLLALAAGVSIGVLIESPYNPVDTSAEAGFARDMQTHHAQAVEMSMIAYQRSGDPQIRTIAYDIALAQQGQIGIMHDWLDQWRLSPTSMKPAMSWMAGHSTDANGLMPGMATKDQIAQLRQATGRDLDVLYSQLMIRHHLGGIMMVDGVLAAGDRAEVLALARLMKRGQQNEITAFSGFLTRNGAAPL